MNSGSEPRYWIWKDGEAAGPFSRDEVVPSSTPETLVSYENGWKKFSEHPDFKNPALSKDTSGAPLRVQGGRPFTRVQCNSCGASLQLASDRSTATCQFCGNVYVAVFPKGGGIDISANAVKEAIKEGFIAAEFEKTESQKKRDEEARLIQEAIKEDEKLRERKRYGLLLGSPALLFKAPAKGEGGFLGSFDRDRLRLILVGLGLWFLIVTLLGIAL